jgi:hypothetical protein
MGCSAWLAPAHALGRAALDLAVQKIHTQCLSPGKAAAVADFAHQSATGTDVEAVPDETDSCEHVCRSRQAVALRMQPVTHSLEQSNCAAEARMVDTGTAVAEGEVEEDTHTAVQPCGRS